MNTTTVLDLIAARETARFAARDQLREQMTELAAIECELAGLATTRPKLLTAARSNLPAACRASTPRSPSATGMP